MKGGSSGRTGRQSGGGCCEWNLSPHGGRGRRSLVGMVLTVIGLEEGGLLQRGGCHTQPQSTGVCHTVASVFMGVRGGGLHVIFFPQQTAVWTQNPAPSPDEKTPPPPPSVPPVCVCVSVCAWSVHTRRFECLRVKVNTNMTQGLQNAKHCAQEQTQVTD